MALTLDQITRTPVVMGIIQEYNSPGSTFSRFYKLGLTDRPGQILDRRTGVYDVFNPTRTMPVGRAPQAGPSRVARQPVGQKLITVARFYESIEITYENIFGTRPLGGRYGTVDPTGKGYITRQINHETAKFHNLHEFLAFQCMRGGWSYIAENGGEDLYPVIKGTSNSVMDVDTLVPAEHQNQLPIGPGGADIISESWDDPDARLIDQFHELDKIHAVRNGNPLRHIWLNGTTMKHLYNNNQLRSVRGDAYMLFESMTNRPKDPTQIYPDTGYDVVFPSIPNWRFHVYNQAYIPGLVPTNFNAQTDMDNIHYFIPDGEVIITPEPGEWCEKVVGTEPVQFMPNEQVINARGFITGRTFEIEPPRVDLKFLENYAPVITQKNSVYNPTVIFGGEGTGSGSGS